MDASEQRDLHDAIWRSSGGFDLVLAPVIIALLGLWIDSQAGPNNSNYGYHFHDRLKIVRMSRL